MENRGLPFEWCKSYLPNRHHFVEINNKRSSSLLTERGVPQGSVLGPLFILVYINDMNSSINLGELLMLADDTSYLKIGKDSVEIRNSCEITTVKIVTSCQKNCLV